MVQAVHSGRFFFYSALTLVFTLFGLSGCGGSNGGSSTPEMSINNPSVAEGGESDSTTLTFTLSLSETADEDLTVEIGTVNGTAEAGEDYTARTGETLTIREGDTSATFTVDITGDDDFERDETFSVQISNPQGPELEGSQTLTATGTITNDDNADRGYFAGTGTLNGTEYDDLIALVYNPRIMLFSPSANVLYDIQMTRDVNQIDYSGTVQVYEDGQIVQIDQVTVEGQTNSLIMTGTFSGGTGIGTGSFSVTYDLENNEGAGEDEDDFSRIEASDWDWKGNLYGYDHQVAGTGQQETGQFYVLSSGLYSGVDDNNEHCQFPNVPTANLVILNLSVNIFRLSHAIHNQGFGDCAPPYESSGHSGFAAVVDGTENDSRLYFAFDNGETAGSNAIALFGVMDK